MSYFKIIDSIVVEVTDETEADYITNELTCDRMEITSLMGEQLIIESIDPTKAVSLFHSLILSAIGE